MACETRPQRLFAARRARGIGSCWVTRARNSMEVSGKLEDRSLLPVLEPRFSNVAGNVGYRLKALTRNAAICPRVTELAGQYMGGANEHPCVMFNTAIRSTKL